MSELSAAHLDGDVCGTFNGGKFISVFRLHSIDTDRQSLIRQLSVTHYDVTNHWTLAIERKEHPSCMRENWWLVAGFLLLTGDKKDN